MQLNEEQTAALTQMSRWYNQSSGPYFVLAGHAGTGKTTTCAEFIKLFPHSAVVNVGAPTNKATKVIRRTYGTLSSDAPEGLSFSTTYSVLGLKMEKDGAVKKLTAKKDRKNIRIKDCDIVIVDEASMVNSVLMEHLQIAVRMYGVKVLFMGDPAQLPPVNELTSPVWQMVKSGQAECARLTQVMRHDNQILTLCTNINEAIRAKDFARIDMRPDFDTNGGVRYMAPVDFVRSIRKHARHAQGGFVDGTSKVIAWRNDMVRAHNRTIREELYSGADPEGFMFNERVVFAEPIYDDDDSPLAHTDDEGRVVSAAYGQHPDFPYKVCQLSIEVDNDEVIEPITCYVLNSSSEQARLQQQLSVLAEKARSEVGYYHEGSYVRYWDIFWALKEAFNDIRYAYAITAHRAQGSTYTTAYVNFRDILANPRRDEAHKCLYVGCSRPTTNLILG